MRLAQESGERGLPACNFRQLAGNIFLFFWEASSNRGAASCRARQAGSLRSPAPDRLVVLPSLLLDSLQKKRGPDKGDEHTETKRGQIDGDVGKARAIQIHQAKGAAEMGERKKFREVADQFR